MTPRRARRPGGNPTAREAHLSEQEQGQLTTGAAWLADYDAAEPALDEPLEMLLASYDALVAELGRLIVEHLDEDELGDYFGEDPLGVGRLPEAVMVDVRTAATFSWRMTRRIEAERAALAKVA